MLLNLFYRYPAIAVVLWAALYISDYYLTIAGARLYRAASDHVAFEGSYELTPQFQKDIDALRRVSPRFLVALAASCLLLVLLWILSVRTGILPGLFIFGWGALALREVAVHMRHFRNISLFRLALKQGGLTGQLTYSRWLVLRSSAHELFAYAGLFACLAVLVNGWFFAGGAVACLATALQQLRLAGRAAHKAEASA